MEALSQGSVEVDVDHFLDWREVGLSAVRDVLDRPFSWSLVTPQIEYEMREVVEREVRRGWHPIANQFYLYWRAKRDEVGGVPDRADIDPMLEIPLICPHICIFEPALRDDGRQDWFCRLMGTHVEQALGFSLNGRSVSDFYPNPSSEQIQRYGLVADQQFVSHRSGPSRTQVEERVGRVESLYVPLTDKRRGIRLAFGVAIYQWLPV